jgi:hypothetical protein
LADTILSSGSGWWCRYFNLMCTVASVLIGIVAQALYGQFGGRCRGRHIVAPGKSNTPLSSPVANALE